MRKPIAEAVADHRDFGPGRRLVVADVGMGVFSYDTDEANVRGTAAVDVAVAQINAAVEAREAKLLGAVVELIRRHETLGPIFTAVENLCADVFKLHPDGEAVSGDVACALAFDLGVEQMRTAAFGPLLDLLLAQGGQASRLAFELAKALGLATEAKWTNEMMLRLADDEELRAECSRRWFPRTAEIGLETIARSLEAMSEEPQTATATVMRIQEQQQREQRVANAAAQLLIEQLRHWMRQPGMQFNIEQIALDDRLRETARYITRIPRMLAQYGWARFAARNPTPPSFARIGETTAQTSHAVDITVDGVMRPGWDAE